MLVVPALPPGFLMKGRDSTGLAKFELTTLDDFTKALRLTKSRPQWDESAIYKSDSVGRLVALFPTVEEVERFCLEAEGKPLALDTETTGEQVLDCRLICCGFASANGAVLCVPFLKKGGTAYWAPHDEQRVREALKKLLSSQTTPKVIHNKSFDEIVLWSHGLPVSGPTFDTMQASHVTDAELPHSLGYCGTRYLDIRYWKDDVKGDEGWLQLNDEILRLYNLRDALVCLRLMPIYSAELTKLKLWDLFDEEQRLASLMARATIRGLSVDFVRRDGGQELNKKTGQYELIKGLGPTLHEQMNLAFAQLQYIAGRSNFDPLKPTDVRELLYDRLKLPVVKLTPSGLPGTDKEAMTLLALAADNDWQRAAIKALADFRAAQKMLSTFVEGLPVLGDGALHVSWKLLAVTGRFTSSPNAQNHPQKLKRIFKARDGFKFVGSDLSQAELRSISYFADEPTLLEMYRRGINVHTVNAGLLFRSRPEAGHKDMDAVTEAYLRNEAVPQLLGQNVSFDAFTVLKKNAWKSTRTLAKVSEFSAIYGAEDDTKFSNIRSKRDPDTNDLMFPGLRRSEIEATTVMWKKLRKGVVAYWDRIQQEVKARGYAVCPISGRIRWFRGGLNRNEILNWNIQTSIASIMNKRMLEIQDVFDQETGGQALVVQQVHDAVNCEAPNGYEQRAAEVLNTILAQPVALPRYPNAMFPPDPALIGSHLDQI